MTLVKHTQRMRKGCSKCGVPIFWFHDTDSPGFKRRCSSGSDACRAHGLEGRLVSWVACDEHGTKHVCAPRPVEPTPRPVEAPTGGQCEKCGEVHQTRWQLEAHRLDCRGDYSWNTPKPVEAPAKPVEAKPVDESAVRDLLDILGRLGGTVNPDQVREIVREEIKSAILPTVVEVRAPNGEIKRLESVHKVFPEVLTMMQVDNVWLTGPAGTGKSTIAKNCSEALGVPFGFISLTVTTPVSEIVGYRDANGNYQDTIFRRIYELCDECGPDNCSHGRNGGVFLWDEMDNGSSNTIGKVNEALANGQMAFPDKVVHRHPRCYQIAAGNTYGTGPDRQYVGRTQLDAATLDRFAQVFVPIDDALEESAASAVCEDRDKVFALLHKVRALRARAEELKMNVIFSPRATIKGAELLQAGVLMDRVIQVRVRKGISDQDWARLNS